MMNMASLPAEDGRAIALVTAQTTVVTMNHNALLAPPERRVEAAARDRLHSTSGGESDTELKEFAVRPITWPSAARAVTMVTPVANMPSAARNSGAEKLGGWAWRGGVMVIGSIA